MGHPQLLLFCIILYIGGAWGATWEFGKDRRGSVVISTGSGDIGILQKATRVPLTVPQCYKVVHVKVEVQNDLTTPEVTYLKDTFTVIIRYKLLQSSYSKYYITVKAVKDKKCGQQPRHRFVDPEEDYSIGMSDIYRYFNIDHHNL